MTKLFLSNSPFIRLLLPLLLGIWICEWIHWPIAIRVSLCLLCFILLALYVFINNKNPSYQRRYWSGVFSILFVINFGMAYKALRSETIINSGAKAEVCVTIHSWIGETDKSNKYEVHLEPSSSDSLKKVYGHKGILYVSKQKCSTVFNAGDRVGVGGYFLPFSKPVLPNQFDYSQYLINHRTTFRIYGNKVHKISTQDSGFSLSLMIPRFKSYVNNRLTKFGLGRSELAIINAMFMGDRYNLSYEQKNSFAVVGAVHLLAVSGLHVGIIYLLLVFVAKCFIKSRIAVFIVVFWVLWLYAVFTGLSASVLRATIMFSIIEIGHLSKRRIHMVNLLSVSMFLILLIDPLFLYDIGFWLSHLAVASIVFFYPWLNKLVYFRFPPFRWAWSVMMISISAQLGTLPVALYVFHQFSSVFLFANWLLIPVVTPILLLSMIVVIGSPFNIVLRFVVPGLNDLLTYMDSIVKELSQLDKAVIVNIPFHWSSMLLIYVLLILFIVVLETKKRIAFKWTLIIGITFILGLHLNKYYYPKEGLLVVEIRNGIIVNYFNAEVNEVYATSEVTSKEIEYMFSGFWMANGLNRDWRLYQKCANKDSLITPKVIREVPYLFVRGCVKWPQIPLNNKNVCAIVIDNGNISPSELELFTETVVQDTRSLSMPVLRKNIVLSDGLFGSD